MEAYNYICLYAVLKPGIQLIINNSPRLFSKLCPLRKALKDETYKIARLAPRISDPDFYNNKGEMIAQIDENQDVKMEEYHLDLYLEENGDVPTLLRAFFESTNILTTPFVCIPAIANGSNNTMMKLFSIADQGLGMHKNLEAAAKCLMEQAWLQVMEIMPEKFDAPLVVLDKIRSHNLGDVLRDHLKSEAEDFKFLLQSGIGLAKLKQLRLQVWIHIAKTLGLQTCRVPEGPNVGLHPFLPSLIREILERLASDTVLIGDEACHLVKLSLPFPGQLSDYVKLVTEQLWQLHVKCLAGDARSYTQKSEELQNVLGKVKKVTLESQLKEYGINSVSLQQDKSYTQAVEQMELFPASRAKVISAIMIAFDKQHEQSKVAHLILQNPTEFLYNALEAAAPPATTNQVVPRPPDGVATSSSSVSSVVASDKSDKPLTLPNWWQMCVASEKEASDKPITLPAQMPECEVRMLIADANRYFMNICATQPYKNASALQVKPGSAMADPPKEKKRSAAKKLGYELMFINQSHSEAIELPYWGNVVGESVAQFLSREQLVDKI